VRPKRFMSLVCLSQTVHLSAPTLTLSPNRSKWLPLEPCHLAVAPGAFKTISKPMVCSMQTMHLSCSDTNTISEWIEMSFHLSLVT
jgi:hypothetical protein